MVYVIVCVLKQKLTFAVLKHFSDTPVPFVLFNKLINLEGLYLIIGEDTLTASTMDDVNITMLDVDNDINGTDRTNLTQSNLSSIAG